MYGSTVTSNISSAEMILLVLVHKQHQGKDPGPLLQAAEWGGEAGAGTSLRQRGDQDRSVAISPWMEELKGTKEKSNILIEVVSTAFLPVQV